MKHHVGFIPSRKRHDYGPHKKIIGSLECFFRLSHSDIPAFTQVFLWDIHVPILGFEFSSHRHIMYFNFGYYSWSFSEFSTGYNSLGESIEVKYKPIAVLRILVAIFVKLASCAINCTNVKQFPTVNKVNIFGGGSYNNQKRPNILHGKVLATCVAILGAHPNTIRLINEMLRVPVNRD